MASTLLFLTPLSSFTRFQTARLASQREESHNARLYKHRSCVASLKNEPLALTEPTAVRRSGNYQPCIWGLDYLLSLKNEYKNEEYLSRAEKLKGDVSTMLGNMKAEPLSQLELIDDLQRLGLAYHFQKEIKNVVHNNYNNSNNNWTKSDLHGTAVAFRLFRQHGYHVPQEVFNQFKDRTGSFQMCLCNDIKGMHSLYEASYLSTEGEEIMEEAWDFTSKHLKNNQGNLEPNLEMLVSHALELPLHWRVQRLETRWFIDVYESRSEKNHILLELAKLDFNIVQGIHQEDLREISRCWKSTGLEEQMSFIRDTPVVSFIWGMGISSEPQYAYCRRMVTKAIQLISAIDDFYDVYGTLDEIELFTDAIERWEISAMSTSRLHEDVFFGTLQLC